LHQIKAKGCPFARSDIIKNAFRHGEKLPFLFSLLYYLFSGKVAGERLEKSEEYKKKKPLARLFFLARVDKKDAAFY
jgi:hypothetical protein